MARKNRSKKRKDPGGGEDFKVNPFAGLHLDVPDVPEEEDATAEDSPVQENDPEEEEPVNLSREDRELLQAFSDSDAIEFEGRRPSVSLQVQNRARGKKVTCVSGLESLDALEQMELARELKTRLGIGARFNDGTLELQGDQRRRAVDWFQTQGYDVTVQ